MNSKPKSVVKIVSQKISAKSPKSLYSRFLLITIVPVLLIQLITTYIFYERHWSSLSRNMVASLTGEISTIVSVVEDLDDAESAKFFLENAKYNALIVNLQKNQKLDTFKNRNDSYPELIQNIRSTINNPLAIFHEPDDSLRISIQTGEDVLNINFSEKRIANPSTYIFILWMLTSSLLLTIISVLFLRGQVRSILNLSHAAENFGKGGDLKDFKPSGAREIRAAGIAFIEMRERIKRLIDTRTQMLAGVSHDIKTPLTRMKLILSLLTDKSRKEQLETEVDDMTKMIEGYLSFAQLETQNQTVEAIQELNLNKFISDIIERYKAYPNKIAVNVPENIIIHLRPEYFKRALSNLIDNSIKYAKSLEVSAQLVEGNAIIHVDDDGPGIPENKLEQVFQPFYRLDESRNSETGGVGLGLSIARDIVQKHGGDIQLSRSPSLHGLRATIILPK